MDIKLFQQKLNEICTIAEENGKQLSQQQIREHFDESDLSTSQLVKILQYLKLKGITIEGAEEAASAAAAANTSSESGSEEELPGTRAALTAEEQAYLNDYMESFSPEGLDSDDLTSLFQAFAKGDTAAEGALTQFYMAQAAQMAAELNCEEITWLTSFRRRIWPFWRLLRKQNPSRRTTPGCAAVSAAESSMPSRNRPSRNSVMTIWYPR